MRSIFIIGATATGKTDLAISLVPILEKLPGVNEVDILSADSKQVYLGQDIVTGKDSVLLSKLRGVGKVQIYGLDLIKPNKSWSVANFLDYAQSVFQRAAEDNRIVVVVGGTGLYLSSLINPPRTAIVPQDLELRARWEKRTVRELREKLATIDEAKLTSMNSSDGQNPRRLVRAIEVAIYNNQTSPMSAEKPLVNQQVLIVELTAPKELLIERIRRRVVERLAAGAVEEFKQLQKTYSNSWTKEAKAAIGYEEIGRFCRGEITRTELVQLWTLHEVQYAKRQKLWFGRIKHKLKFEISAPDFKENIVKSIKDWYT